MVAVRGEDVQVRAGRVRPRAGGLDHRRQLPRARPHARPQRAHRARVPDVGDVRQPAARRASSTSTRSRAAPRRCATSSSRSRPTACSSRATPSRWARPIFTPYIEMTHLEDYALNVVNIAAPQENRFQFTDAEIKKLEDPKIKAFFLVNPGNPTGVALSKETIGKIAHAREDEAPGPDAPDRRRVRDVRPRLPLAARRAAAEHDRRLLVLEVLRLHGLAARRHRRSTRTTSSTR